MRLTGAILVLFGGCINMAYSQDTLSVRSLSTLKVKYYNYSGYNGTQLSAELKLTKPSTKYDSLIHNSMELVGLPNNDIEIETTSEFGTYSLMNRLSQRRSIVYSVAYFDSVYKVTQSLLAIQSICFHELAHLFYHHPLKPESSSQFNELQADRYSGVEMAIVGATLDQSLAAMKSFGNDKLTTTHPAKADRLAEIEQGYLYAKIYILKDTSYVKKDSVNKLHALELAFNKIAQIQSPGKVYHFMEPMGGKSTVEAMIVSKKKIPGTIYTLYGKLIYIANQSVKLAGNNERIGSIDTGYDKMGNRAINLDAGSTFLLDSHNVISCFNPDGSKMEVGRIVQFN